MLFTHLSTGADHPRPGGGYPVLPAAAQGPAGGGPGGRLGWPGGLCLVESWSRDPSAHL